MFWGNKNKTDKRKAGQNEGMDKSRRLREEAMANVRTARAHIGEETLDRIAAAMTKKQQSATEQAKARIQSADADRVVDEIMLMLDDKD